MNGYGRHLRPLWFVCNKHGLVTVLRSILILMVADYRDLLFWLLDPIPMEPRESSLRHPSKHNKNKTKEADQMIGRVSTVVDEAAQML
jgi:hypothetical protein